MPRETAGPTPYQAIVYVSTASRRLDEQDMQDLLHASRQRNLQEDITGVLLYCDGNFMQYIEGPAAALARVYGLIEQDRRHHGVIKLCDEAIAGPVFPAWSMAYTAVQIEQFERLNQASWRAQDRGEAPYSGGHALLRHIAQRLVRAGERGGGR